MPGGPYFSLLMAAVAVWAFMDACNAIHSDPGSVLVFIKLSYAGIVTVPPLWLLFTLAYSRRDRWTTPPAKLALFIIPAITFVLIATNEHHGLVWAGVTPVFGPSGTDLEFTWGIWAILHFTYSYGLIFAGLIILAREFLRSYARYRVQTAMLFTGATIPLAGNIVYVAGLSPLGKLDLSPIIFCVTGILFTWGIFRHRLFDIVPVARETLINSMADGVLVLGQDDTILDMNPAAGIILGADGTVTGQPLQAVMAKYPAIAGCCRDGRLESREVAIDGVNGKRWIDLQVSALSGDTGQSYGKLVALRDITEHMQAGERLRQNNEELRARELELRESEERWRQLVEFNPACIAIHSEGKVIYVNRAGMKMMGAAREEELVGQPALRFVHPDYHGMVIERIRQAQETGMTVEPLEEKFLLLDGRVLDVEVTTMPVTYMGRDAIMAVVWDINDRKQAGEKLAASLREKELLLKEIHHRVKNNLQIISSLLSLQTAGTASAEASAVLIDSQNRIRSMALIHEKLYQSSDFARIDFREYIESLVGSLSRSYITARDIHIARDIADMALDIDMAIPCGLIINELITNSLKYAFKDGAGGELRVSMKAEDGLYTLIVSDDGAGLPPGLDFRNTATLGLQLVMTLTGQLNGDIELLEGKGTTFRITFTEQAAYSP
jgi:hypothetical protein